MLCFGVQLMHVKARGQEDNEAREVQIGRKKGSDIQSIQVLLLLHKARLLA